MITDEVIRTIYKLNRKPQKGLFKAQIEHLIDTLKKTHDVAINSEELILKDLEEESPFRVVLINKIMGIEEFERTMAVILPNCILFFSKETNDIHIHIKMPKMSFKDKLKSLF